MPLHREAREGARPRASRSRGQTLIIALLVLFVLLIFGLVVILILGREITSTGQARRRNIANELAQAGVRYCFAQLRFSEEGADWRPVPPAPVPAEPPRPSPGLGILSDPENPGATNPDPDFYWLRRYLDETGLLNDRGGPDGLGAFTRLNFDNGRALVRVRYAPSGEELFTGGVPPIGERGKLRAYTIIESVGRPGRINPLDPTSSREPNLQSARQLTAVASIGIIEHARYVTNKDRRNQLIDLGVPADFGSRFRDRTSGLDETVQVPMVIGGTRVPTTPGSYPGNQITLGGSIYANAGLRVFGDLSSNSGLQVFLNEGLGDQINIHGPVLFAEAQQALRITHVTARGGTEVQMNLTALPTADPNFSTFQGVYRDIADKADAQGYARNVPYKDPPLIDEEDPNTGQLRYRQATRDSGALALDGLGRQFNLGRFGHGRGVYINNTADLNRDSEDGNYTQRFDWLNPNKHPDGRWQGPFYVPPAAYVLLLPDGFLIGRNISNTRDTWRDYTARDTGRHALRYKIGLGSGGSRDVRIINELTPGIVSFGTPGAADFDRGVPFNGLIFCEGNVRVRGVIGGFRDGANSRGFQVTIVSMGTGYVEGSIMKAFPESSLAILCKDNVVLNTSQFVGSNFSNTLRLVRDNNDPTSPWRIRIPFDAMAQVPFDPGTFTYSNPFQTTPTSLTPSLFVAHAADFDQSAFINLLVNEDANASPPTYMFSAANPPNAAAPFFPLQDPIPTYGLADPSRQVLPVYEKRSFQFWPIDPASNGQFTLFNGGVENVFRFKPDNTIAPPNRGDYFLSRVGAQPMDVLIEAAMYAQEGSFFVIPGPWFNWNPNDRRDSFTNAQERGALFSASVEYPFYGEPVDINVTIVGSVSENFPPLMADQSEWLRHWSWIPAEYGASGLFIPDHHYPRDANGRPVFTNRYVPNLFINYDTTLISGRVGGSFEATALPVRTDQYGRALPPMPKLPVGTRLVYFGEVNP